MRNADLAANRGDVHNPAAAILDHLRQRRQRGIDRSPEHYVHGLAEILCSLREQRAHRDGSGIVHQDVNAPEPLLREAHQVFRIVLLADVTGKSCHFRAQRFNLLLCAP